MLLNNMHKKGGGVNICSFGSCTPEEVVDFIIYIEETTFVK